jgi:hypothetical protein
MSSPTLNLPQADSSTSLETICNLIRALINDSQAGATNTPGEGQIFTDNPAISPFVQPMLNSSIRKLYRSLRGVGDPVLIRDNVIVTGLPIINSPTQGMGSSDPSIQTFLGPEGYFDGTQIWPNFILPNDMLYPTKLWERSTGSNDPFRDMEAPSGGLPSLLQGRHLRYWEWRNLKLNFIGATSQRDIRMRYYCSLPQFFSPTLDFNATFVPVPDCTDFLAFETAVLYATMLGSPGLADLKAEAAAQMFALKNANIRRMQHETIHRIPFGNSDGDLNNEFSFLSW